MEGISTKAGGGFSQKNSILNQQRKREEIVQFLPPPNRGSVTPIAGDDVQTDGLSLCLVNKSIGGGGVCVLHRYLPDERDAHGDHEKNRLPYQL